MCNLHSTDHHSTNESERNAPIVVHSQMDLIGVEMGEKGLCITEFSAEELVTNLLKRHFDYIIVPTEPQKAKNEHNFWSSCRG